MTEWMDTCVLCLCGCRCRRVYLCRCVVHVFDIVPVTVSLGKYNCLLSVCLVDNKGVVLDPFLLSHGTPGADIVLWLH